MAKGTYTTAEEAARVSIWNKALSQEKTLTTARGTYRVVVVWEHGRYYYVYAGALAHRLPDTLAKPSSSDIDSERRWRPW